MKHAKHIRRLPPHVRAAVDSLRRRGAVVLEILFARVVRIVFAIAGRTKRRSLLANPRKVETCARNRCAKVEALCARHARAA